MTANGQGGGGDGRAIPGEGAFVTGVSTPVKRTYSNTSRQARIAWKPVKDLRIRATWGESFLTPQVQQQFGLVYIDDRTFSVGYYGGTLPEGVDYMSALHGSNPNLKPQVATVKTLGFDYMPSFDPNLSFSVTYNDTRFQNYIGDPLAGLSYQAIFSDISKMPAETFTMDDNGVMLWDSRQINFLGHRSRSLDTNLSCFFGNRLGSWRVELNAVRTLELQAQTLASQQPVVFSDSEYGPSKWAVDLYLGWENGNYFASGGAHCTSGHRVMDPFSATGSIYNDFVPNPHPRRHAGSYTTVDFQVGYRWLGNAGWLGGTTLRLGVQNAFDRAFPFVDNRYGFISNRVNVRGRVVYLDLKKEF